MLTLQDKNGNNLLKKPYSREYEAIDAERRKLPVWDAMGKIVREVQSRRVLVVSSPTGSGKSTQ